MGFISRGEQLVLKAGEEKQLSLATRRISQSLSRSNPSSHAAVNLYWMIWISPICPIVSTWNLLIEFLFMGANSDTGSVLSYNELETGRASLSVLFCQTALSALSLGTSVCLQIYGETPGVVPGTETFIIDVRGYITDDIVTMDHLSAYDMAWKSEWVEWALRRNVLERKNVELAILTIIRKKTVESAIELLNKHYEPMGEEDINHLAGKLTPKISSSSMGAIAHYDTVEKLRDHLGVRRPWYNCTVTELSSELAGIFMENPYATRIEKRPVEVKRIENILRAECIKHRKCLTCSSEGQLSSAKQIEERSQLNQVSSEIVNQTGGFHSIIDKVIPAMLSGAGTLLSKGIRFILGI